MSPPPQFNQVQPPQSLIGNRSVTGAESLDHLHQMRRNRWQQSDERFGNMGLDLFRVGIKNKTMLFSWEFWHLILLLCSTIWLASIWNNIIMDCQKCQRRGWVAENNLNLQFHFIDWLVMALTQSQTADQGGNRRPRDAGALWRVLLSGVTL